MHSKLNFKKNCFILSIAMNKNFCDISEKRGERTAPVKRDLTRKSPGRFEGEPTYKGNFTTLYQNFLKILLKEITLRSSHFSNMMFDDLLPCVL